MTKVVQTAGRDALGTENPTSHGGIFGLGGPNDAYAQYFTGQSYLNPLTDPAQTQFIANVTFEPGCRNNWHIHHAEDGGGQILLVTDGEGCFYGGVDYPMDVLGLSIGRAITGGYLAGKHVAAL